jgi:hypothetical protein
MKISQENFIKLQNNIDAALKRNKYTREDVKTMGDAWNVYHASKSHNLTNHSSGYHDYTDAHIATALKKIFPQIDKKDKINEDIDSGDFINRGDYVEHKETGEVGRVFHTKGGMFDVKWNRVNKLDNMQWGSDLKKISMSGSSMNESSKEVVKENPYISDEWKNGKLHKKIDVYRNGEYLHSTNAYKTLKNATKGAAFKLGISDDSNHGIKSYYSEKYVNTI